MAQRYNPSLASHLRTLDKRQNCCYQGLKGSLCIVWWELWSHSCQQMTHVCIFLTRGPNEKWKAKLTIQHPPAHFSKARKRSDRNVKFLFWELRLTVDYHCSSVWIKLISSTSFFVYLPLYTIFLKTGLCQIYTRLLLSTISNKNKYSLPERMVIPMMKTICRLILCAVAFPRMGTINTLLWERKHTGCTPCIDLAG